MKYLICFFIFVQTSFCYSQTNDNLFINAAEVNELVTVGDFLIDVRTPEEFNEGNIKNAINIDVKNPNFEQRVEKLDRNTPIVLYCKAGGRSAEAHAVLKKKGFKDVKEIKGGYDAWKLSQKAN